LAERQARTPVCWAVTTLVAAAIVAATAQAAGAPAATGVACKRGSVAAIVGGVRVCLRAGQKCLARYERIYQAKGFHCAAGHLQKAAHRSPPPPPPTPHARPGHYQGRTSQNEAWNFDVTPDGTGLVNLTTGQINESCTPPSYLSGGNLNFGAYRINIAANGSFSVTVTLPGNVGGAPSHATVKITGQFSNGLAIGTFVETETFTYQGTAYGCTSNPQTWTASKIG